MPYLFKSYLLLLILFSYSFLNGDDAELKKRLPDKSPLIETNAKELDKVSLACLNFFKISKDEVAMNVGDSLKKSGITQENIIDTLEYINRIQNEDRENISLNKKQADGSPWEFRMSKYWYLKQNFDFYRINGNQLSAKENNIVLPQGKLHITKYAIFEIEVSNRYSKKNNTEIYAVPEWVSPTTGLAQYRLRYTKQQIFDGVYRVEGEAEGKAKVLAYTTKENVESVMLQGTFVACFEDGTRKIFGIGGTNEEPFDKSLKQAKQKRYIYFKETDGYYGYGKTKEEKIKVQPGLTFAGDIKSFGIGKLMLMYYEEPGTKVAKAKIGILADTGAAFSENSYHLDFLLGTYESSKLFYKEADKIPHFCEVYILIKK